VTGKQDPGELRLWEELNVGRIIFNRFSFHGRSDEDAAEGPWPDMCEGLGGFAESRTDRVCVEQSHH